MTNAVDYDALIARNAELKECFAGYKQARDNMDNIFCNWVHGEFERLDNENATLKSDLSAAQKPHRECHRCGWRVKDDSGLCKSCDLIVNLQCERDAANSAKEEMTQLREKLNAAEWGSPEHAEQILIGAIRIAAKLPNESETKKKQAEMEAEIERLKNKCEEATMNQVFGNGCEHEWEAIFGPGIAQCHKCGVYKNNLLNTDTEIERLRAENERLKHISENNAAHIELIDKLNVKLATCRAALEAMANKRLAGEEIISSYEFQILARHTLAQMDAPAQKGRE